MEVAGEVRQNLVAAVAELFFHFGGALFQTVVEGLDELLLLELQAAGKLFEESRNGRVQDDGFSLGPVAPPASASFSAPCR